jgi:hypothetical protein
VTHEYWYKQSFVIFFLMSDSDLALLFILLFNNLAPKLDNQLKELLKHLARGTRYLIGSSCLNLQDNVLEFVQSSIFVILQLCQYLALDVAGQWIRRSAWPLIHGDEIWQISFTPLLDDFCCVGWGSVLLDAKIVFSIQVPGCR